MISIIIPYYNRPKKLERTLNSIYEQSYSDFEIIVIDDCSEILPNSLPEHKINYFRNNENRGPGFSRNLGMAHAKGDYIVFLDSDDYWHKDFLKEIINAFGHNPELIMAYANGYYVDANGKKIEEMRKNAIKSTKILPNIFVDGRPWGTSACVWNKSKIQNIKWIETRCWEDYVFDAMAATICNDVFYVDANLVYYDFSDDDFKLSLQKDLVRIETNRNESLLAITEVIQKSSFFGNEILKKRLIYHAITNAVSLIKLDVKKKEYYQNIKYIVNIFDGKTPFMNMSFILSLNKRLSLKFMRYLRKINLSN